jgi:hypothetical protein
MKPELSHGLLKFRARKLSRWMAGEPLAPTAHLYLHKSAAEEVLETRNTGYEKPGLRHPLRHCLHLRVFLLGACRGGRQLSERTEDIGISSGDRRRRGRVGVRAPVHPISIQL